MFKIVKDWRKIDISCGLVYPNVSKIGLSSYSIRLLYNIINSHENIACERIFLPENIKYPASKDYNPINLLRSIENKVLPAGFDILGISIQSEHDFKNILWFLEKAEIPLTSKERTTLTEEAGLTFPLIIAGGPVVTSNPMPISQIFDIMFIGDAEPTLDSFFNVYQQFKSSKISFQELLIKTKTIKGLYVPSINNNVKRAILQDINLSSIPLFQTNVSTSNDSKIFEDKFLIEINRGCPFQCKFCISSFHNKPFRIRSLEKIKESIELGCKTSNFETIGLIGSCVSAHPRFYEICERIVNKGKRLTVPSMRIEHLTPKIISVLEKGNVKTITIAPEAGSDRLRFNLGKQISNEKIISVLKRIKKSKIKNVKFYFLTGFPNETEEDIDAIINLLGNINDLGFNKGSLRVNINPCVPKLNTPYGKNVEWYLKENLISFRSRFNKIQQELKNMPSIKLKFKNIKSLINSAKIQAFFSLGDLHSFELLLNYYKEGASHGSLRRSEKTLKYSIDEYFKKIKSCYSPWKI